MEENIDYVEMAERMKKQAYVLRMIVPNAPLRKGESRTGRNDPCPACLLWDNKTVKFKKCRDHND